MKTSAVKRSVWHYYYGKIPSGSFLINMVFIQIADRLAPCSLIDDQDIKDVKIISLLYVSDHANLK